MLTFTHLVRKVSASGATEIRLLSDKPILVAKGNSKRELGEALSSKQVLSILNKSLPKEITRDFRWGHEVQHKLELEEEPWAVRVILKSKNDIRVQLRKATPGSRPFTTDQPSVIGSIRQDGPTKDLSGASQLAGSAASSLDPVPEPIQLTSAQSKSIRALAEGGQITLVYGALAKSSKDIQKALSGLGLKPKPTTDSDVAIEAMRYTDFPVIVLGFDGDYEDDPVYRAVRQLPFHRRLKTFVVLVGPNLRTGDRLLAFSLSVNLAIGIKNANHFGRLFEEAQTLWAQFLTPYHQAIRRMESER